METIATKKNETKKEVKEVKKNVPNYLDMIRLYGATIQRHILIHCNIHSGNVMFPIRIFI